MTVEQLRGRAHAAHESPPHVLAVQPDGQRLHARGADRDWPVGPRARHLVISDEIYEHLLYEDAQSAHIVKLVPELANQAVILNGVAKTYAMTGWRVGWMIGPSDASRPPCPSSRT